MSTEVQRVTVVQPWLASYRLGLFDRLHVELGRSRIGFSVVCPRASSNDPAAATNAIDAVRPYVQRTAGRVFLGGFRYLSLPVHTLYRGVVVVDDAIRNLNTVRLVTMRTPRVRLVLWGHGVPEWQSATIRKARLAMIKRADYYFAYTESGRERLLKAGLATEKVFTIQNAVAAPKIDVSPAECAALRRELGLEPADRVVLFCGAMYQRKRIDLLVDAADLIKNRYPETKFVFAGAGPELAGLLKQASNRPHLYVIPPVSGTRKAALFGIAEIVAAPGAAGLVIVDALTFGAPPIVCRGQHHGPEVDYVQDGFNGVVAEPNVESLASHLLAVLHDGELHRRLVRGCQQSAAQITEEAMTSRFLAALYRVCN